MLAAELVLVLDCCAELAGLADELVGFVLVGAELEGRLATADGVEGTLETAGLFTFGWLDVWADWEAIGGCCCCCCCWVEQPPTLTTLAAPLCDMISFEKASKTFSIIV